MSHTIDLTVLAFLVMLWWTIDLTLVPWLWQCSHYNVCCCFWIIFFKNHITSTMMTSHRSLVFSSMLFTIKSLHLLGNCWKSCLWKFGRWFFLLDDRCITQGKCVFLEAPHLPPINPDYVVVLLTGSGKTWLFPLLQLLPSHGFRFSAPWYQCRCHK